MKIMHVLKHAVRGNGHVHVAVDLACAQADAGHDVVVASARGSYDELLRSHGVRVLDVTEPTGKVAAARSARDLLKLARRVRPDVIHAHMMSSAVLGFPVARLTGAALITTVHNSFDGHSSLMRLGSMVVAVSDAERTRLLERGFPADRTVFVLNGADRSPREELPRDDIGNLDRPCVMTLSGLHPRKAVDDIIRAFARVHPEFPHWHLNVVGWGAERENLEKLGAELGLGSSIRFLGSTLTPRYLLDQADIFASASLADPCPLTTTEARGAGAAIVGTTVGGVPEVLDHGRAGQLVPPNDPDAMAEVFRGLMKDPVALEEWRGRARHGSEYFAVTRVAEDYQRVYEQAVARRRRSA